MFRKVIVYQLFEMIKKKKECEPRPWARFWPLGQVGSGMAARAVLEYPSIKQ